MTVFENNISVNTPSYWVSQSMASPSLCLCCFHVAEHICGVFMLQHVITLRIFDVRLLLFYCFVYRQNVTCLK